MKSYFNALSEGRKESQQAWELMGSRSQILKKLSLVFICPVHQRVQPVVWNLFQSIVAKERLHIHCFLFLPCYFKYLPVFNFALRAAVEGKNYLEMAE